MTDIGIADFITDELLLGPWFSGESWRNWLVVLRAAFGERLAPKEREWFKDLAEREPPAKRCRELWLAVGRRGGKDSVASGVAVYFAVTGDYLPRLRPGERATIVCLAVDRSQAKIVHGYIKAYFELCPLLAELVYRVTADTVQLNNGVDIVVATCSYRAVRGKSVALAIMDEVAFWREEGGSYVNPDTEIYSALLPSLATLRGAGAMIIGISTVHRKSGLLWQKWRECHGQDGSDILVIRAPSIVFNPLLDQADIDADIALDPQRGEAEWLSEWRTDLQDFVDRAVIEACVVPRRHELPLLQGTRYYGFTDASGGSGGDSYTAAVAHYDQRTEMVVLDGLREIRPPFSPEVATAEHAAFFKSYRISNITGDRYAGQWPADQYMRHGVSYTPSERSKSEIYLETLPALNAHRVELLDNPRLISQFCGLERRVVRGSGREVVDHGAGRRDDVANSAAGALLAALEAGKHRLVITDEMLAKARAFRRSVRPWGGSLHSVPAVGFGR